ncbi:hypothetical protein ACJX0J_034794, partial [Zea mays]
SIGMMHIGIKISLFLMSKCLLNRKISKREEIIYPLFFPPQTSQLDLWQEQQRHTFFPSSFLAFPTMHLTIPKIVILSDESMG